MVVVDGVFSIYVDVRMCLHEVWVAEDVAHYKGLRHVQAGGRTRAQLQSA